MVLPAHIALGVIIAAAEPTGTLALACEGTSEWYLEGTKPTLDAVSFGIIVDFTNRAVKGLPSYVEEEEVKVTRVDERSINFEGRYADSKRSINGSIDRVTGDLTALDKLGNLKTFYSLQCKPTQRMF
jgi:hypothetical protein